MRLISNYLATTSLVLVAAFATPALAADLDATSSIDAVTVYPDGASVTRIITFDLPSGDNTLVAKDFPLSLDRASLRIEGEAGEKLTIGAIDTRTPKPVLPANLSEIDKQIEALKDQRADLDGAIASAEARRKFAERFAEASPAGLGDKGEARPLAEWRAAFGAVAEEVASADTAIREAQRKQRDLDRDLARLQQDRNVKPPGKLEVRIDLATVAATKATLHVTYSVKNAHWTPLYDARLDTGAKDRKPALELVRRAEITQATGEDWSNVTLGVSTVRVARGGDAPDLNSVVVRYPEPPRARKYADSVSEEQDSAKVQRLLPASAPAGFAADIAEKADEQQATAEIGAFQAAFKIPGRVSVDAGQGARALRISSVTIAPDLVIRSVPVLDPTAYLEASFVQSEDAPLLPGRISIYRDGMFVGQRQDGCCRQGREGAARLRRRRQGQDRARGAQAQRGLQRFDRYLEDRRARVQDQRAQRPRLPDQGRDRGPASGQRERRDRRRAIAVIDTADHHQPARQARGAGMGVRGEAERGKGHQFRLAHALAQGQGRGDGTGRLMPFA